MDSLKLAQLRFFCAVMEAGSIVAASRRLNCVASNVTARLRELEQSVGHPLFLREKGRLIETPAGRAFYAQAHEVVQKASALEHFFEPDVPRGVLRLGALDVALHHFLPQRLPSFMQAFADVELQLLKRASYTLERMLMEREVDLALTDGPIEHPLLESCLVFTQHLRLVAPVHVASVAAIDWASTDVLLFNTDCFYRSVFESWMKKNRVTPRRIQTIESYQVIFACVRAGLGVCCSPDVMLPAPHAQGLHVMTPPDLPEAPVYCVWRRDGATPLLMRLVDHLRGQTA
ncbi:LysR family transcriptional regulator [Acetobacter sp. LMG 32666]|uniref:LysR family transcriptional regulator n=1 Tax=Acetobacter sp. LMG 32666 TaxID=2959295 RepID=UPI0030C7D54A